MLFSAQFEKTIRKTGAIMIDFGLFITLEGIDGIGKSSIASKLKEYFENLGKDIFMSKEPGDEYFGSRLGTNIRELLFKSPKAENMAPGVADLLFLADHVQNSYNIMKEQAEGKIVICDRYADSQFAYMRSSSNNCNYEIEEIYKKLYGFEPDIIIYLRAYDIETGWCLERAKARVGREKEKQAGKPWNDIDNQVRIQKGYDTDLSKKRNVVTIDIFHEDSIEIVYNNIVRALKAFKSKKNLGSKWPELK
jgi:dTMP kinase